MPIRHCQKCGLKVLIGQEQAEEDPFLCQRCSAAGSEGADSAVADDPAKEEPVSGPKKVSCVHCQAGFSAKLPTKPARGSCPVCRKPLVLLPDGEVIPADGFETKTWTKKPAGEIPDSAPIPEDDLLTEKVLPIPPAAMSGGGDGGISDATPVDSMPPVPSAIVTPDLSDPGTIDPAELDPAVVVPEEAPEESQKPKKKKGGRLAEIAKKRGGAGSRAPVKVAKGKGLVAAFFFLLPLIAGGAVYALRDGALKEQLTEIGNRAVIGVGKVLAAMKSAPEPVEEPEEEPEVEPPEEPKDTGPDPAEEARLREGLEDMITTQWLKHRKLERGLTSLGTGATKKQKNAMRQSQTRHKAVFDKYKELQSRYKKKYGKEFPVRDQ